MYRRFHTGREALDFVAEYNAARKGYYAKVMAWPYATDGAFSVFVPLTP